MADVPALPAEMRAAAYRLRQDAGRVLHLGTIRALLISADELVALADAMEKPHAGSADAEPSYVKTGTAASSRGRHAILAARDGLTRVPRHHDPRWPRGRGQYRH